MTINEATGQNIHNFRALGELFKMGRKSSLYTIYASDTAIAGGKSFTDSTSFARDWNVAITYNFPCDYDILSDILNGIGPQGQNLNAVKTFNPSSGVFGGFGSFMQGNLGSITNSLFSTSSKGTSKQQNVCDSEVEKWLLKRQARMGLLEKDKITFRVTVPWSPWLHVGQMFRFQWDNRYDPTQKTYGTRDYLIVHLTHNIQFGGYAVTTLDCIANTIGV